jgi:pimeloyl-ACP methyl ester carboxylesterase
VLIPNAYYRTVSSTAAPLRRRCLPTKQRASADSQWRAAAGEEAVFADSRAYVAFLDARRRPTRAAPRTLGFDVGSINAFHVARALPDRIGAVAAIYPAGTATPRPNSPHLSRQTEQGRLLRGGRQERRHSRTGRQGRLTKAFADAGLPGTGRSFTGQSTALRCRTTRLRRRGKLAAWSPREFQLPRLPDRLAPRSRNER